MQVFLKRASGQTRNVEEKQAGCQLKRATHAFNLFKYSAM